MNQKHSKHIHSHDRQLSTKISEQNSTNQTSCSKTLQTNKAPALKLEDILGKSISRQDAFDAIRAAPDAFQIFSSFPSEEQERLISFIQGAQGLKITYDSFFKHVMNPDSHPSRLTSFLSSILEQEIKIHAVLPIKGTHMTDSGSFVIMDIAVELSDGTIINVEIQKVGYLFPGERASCYISDFIMRQYNRVKDLRGESFSFRDLKPVILIVIMEESSSAFKAVSPEYIHREHTFYNSRAQVSSLHKSIYISLDTFHCVVQNISTKLDAWLTFLSSDRPADIIRLVSAHPEFLSCYHDIMEFRRNPKELIYMYSEALAILDHNTEVYMNEELKKENAALTKKKAALTAALIQTESKLTDTESKLTDTESKLTDTESKLTDTESKLTDTESKLTETRSELTEKNLALNDALSQIESLRKQIEFLTAKH